MLSYFMAEGVLCQQQLLYFCNDTDRKPLADRLPAHAKKNSAQDKAPGKSQQGADAELKIAWQYRRSSLYMHSCISASTAQSPRHDRTAVNATTRHANHSPP